MKNGPNHPGGIASPDHSQQCQAAPFFYLGYGASQSLTHQTIRLTAHSYASTEDVLLRRRFSTGVSGPEGVGFRCGSTYTLYPRISGFNTVKASSE